MRDVQRATKSMRTYVRRLKAAARRDGRPAPRVYFNEALHRWEIRGLS